MVEMVVVITFLLMEYIILSVNFKRILLQLHLFITASKRKKMT